MRILGVNNYQTQRQNQNTNSNPNFGYRMIQVIKKGQPIHVFLPTNISSINEATMRTGTLYHEKAKGLWIVCQDKVNEVGVALEIRRTQLGNATRLIAEAISPDSKGSAVDLSSCVKRILSPYKLHDESQWVRGAIRD